MNEKENTNSNNKKTAEISRKHGTLVENAFQKLSNILRNRKSTLKMIAETLCNIDPTI